MKRTEKRVFTSCICILVCMFLLSSCAASGGSSNDAAPDVISYRYEEGESDGFYSQGADDGGSMLEKLADENQYGGMDEDEISPEYGTMIIYTTYMTIETQDFTRSHEGIIQSLKSLGGYISNSSQYGGMRGDGTYSARSAELTIRIPAENYETFLDGALQYGNVTRRTDSTEDVTTAYIDTEARLESLRTQEQRLLELASMAGSLEDLLKIETELANVRYQIESYTKQLRYLQNQVRYSTITISLQEVTTYTIPQGRNFFGRVWDAIKGSGIFVLRFLEVVLIILIYLLPFLILAAIIYYAFRPLWKKAAQKRRDKRQRKQEERMARMAPHAMMPPGPPVPPRPAMPPPAGQPPVNGKDKNGAKPE